MSDNIEKINEKEWLAAEGRRIRRLRIILSSALALLLVALILASAYMTQLVKPIGSAIKTNDGGNPTLTWIRSIYGWGQSTDKQLSGPQGITVADDGTIWTTDQAKSRIIGFNSDGSYKGMLYQGNRGDFHKSPNALQFPTAVASGPDGNLYVCDQTANQVVVMTPDNKPVLKINIPTPSSIAVSDTRLVVGSSAGFAIMTPKGEIIKIVGKYGKGEDQFMGVRGVAIAKDGTIYVVDQYNNRISAYTTNGERIWIKRTGAPNNENEPQSSIVATDTQNSLQLPAGITIDGVGRLVVADPFGFNLAVLNPKNGNLITMYGDAGNQDGAFSYPSGVSYDAKNDWFVVADTMNARIQIVRLPGSSKTSASTVVRSLSGIWQVLLFPLLLIITLLILVLVYYLRRRIYKKKEVNMKNEENSD